MPGVEADPRFVVPYMLFSRGRVIPSVYRESCSRYVVSFGNKIPETPNFELVGPGVRQLYVPSDDDLTRCRDLGAAVAEAVNARG